MSKIVQLVYRTVGGIKRDETVMHGCTHKQVQEALDSGIIAEDMNGNFIPSVMLLPVFTKLLDAYVGDMPTHRVTGFYGMMLDKFDRAVIAAALDKCGSEVKAASLLGINRATLRAKRKKVGV